MTFTEIDHPRAGSGEFATKPQTSPDVVLTAVALTGMDRIEQILDGRTIETRNPVGPAMTRRALRNTRGEPDGRIRRVRITWDSLTFGGNHPPFEVSGPADGRPLVVDLFSGKSDLVIASGHVIVIAKSVAGNPIRVLLGATATIVADDTKVTVTAEAGSTAELFVTSSTHGFQSIDADATVTIHGDAPRITDSRHFATATAVDISESDIDADHAQELAGITRLGREDRI